MPKRNLRPRKTKAELDALPRCLRVPVELDGPLHGNEHLAELTWHPSDGLPAAAYLKRWLSPRFLSRTTLPVCLTMVDVKGKWVAWTLVCESLNLPGELGLYAARPFSGGEAVAAMLDGRRLGKAKPGSARYARLVAGVPPAGRGYTYELVRGKSATVTLMDGHACRWGGPKRANDHRGLARAPTCVLYGHGWLCLRPFAEARAIAATMSDPELARAELLYDYGRTYWAAC